MTTVVKLGEPVNLRVKKGLIEARVAAIALESGSVGDRIRIRTLEGDKELVAIVTSRESCRIDLGR